MTVKKLPAPEGAYTPIAWLVLFLIFLMLSLRLSYIQSTRSVMIPHIEIISTNLQKVVITMGYNFNHMIFTGDVVC